MLKLKADTEAELQAVAEELLRELINIKNDAQATVLTLSGDLGAGKTTLSKAIALSLGVTEVVTSPTFVVMKNYDTQSDIFTKLVHMDAYRLVEDEELLPLHFADILQTPNTLVIIEWPEKLMSALPESYLEVVIVEDKGARLFTVTAHHD